MIADIKGHFWFGWSLSPQNCCVFQTACNPEATIIWLQDTSRIQHTVSRTKRKKTKNQPTRSLKYENNIKEGEKKKKRWLTSANWRIRRPHSGEALPIDQLLSHYTMIHSCLQPALILLSNICCGQKSKVKEPLSKFSGIQTTPQKN